MSRKIDVIIPVFNRKEILKRAINSVLLQSFRDFNLIVVDDGSTDGTAEMIAKYYPEIIYLYQGNKGVSAARNLGIRSSKASFLTFLDSDDEWHKQKLEKQLDFFNNNPEIKICQTKERWVRKGKFVNPGNKHIKRSGDIFEKSLELCYITPSSVMIKRELLDEYGLFDESLPACEDYDLWLRISWNNNIGLIEEDLLTRYGGHEDQLSAVPMLDKYRIQALEKFVSGESGSIEQKEKAFLMMKQKADIYIKGLLKRDKHKEVLEIKTIVEKMRIVLKELLKNETRFL